MDRFQASFKTDGSGDFEIVLPQDCDANDLKALSPVVRGIREFLAPTLNVAVDQPVPYQLVEHIPPPDLTA